MKTLEYIKKEKRAVKSEVLVLAEEAKRKLGYYKLAERVSSDTPLLDALTKLEIIPYSASSVQKYKDSKRKTGWYSGTKEWMVRFLGVTTLLIVSAVFMWKHVNTFSQNNISFWQGIFIALSIATSIAGVVMFVGTLIESDRIGRGNREITTWVDFPLDNFTGDVPLHVISKAISIKDIVPEARFVVDCMVIQNERRERTQPQPDPFLYVRFHKEGYYIEVWDEEKYEDTLFS